MTVSGFQAFLGRRRSRPGKSPPASFVSRSHVLHYE